MGAAAGEVVLELDEETRVGSGIAVDHLVVVADAEDLELGGGHEPQQQEIGGREVLELVHQEMSAPLLPSGSQRRVAQERLDRAVHLLAVIDPVPLVETAPVPLERGGEPRHVVSFRLHLFGIPQPGADLVEGFHVGAHRVGVGALGHRHQVPQHIPDLRFVDEVEVRMDVMEDRPAE